jgi:hypothetical protein
MLFHSSAEYASQGASAADERQEPLASSAKLVFTYSTLFLYASMENTTTSTQDDKALLIYLPAGTDNVSAPVGLRTPDGPKQERWDRSSFMEECESAPRLNELAEFFASTASGRSGKPLKDLAALIYN